MPHHIKAYEGRARMLAFQKKASGLRDQDRTSNITDTVALAEASLASSTVTAAADSGPLVDPLLS